MPLEVTFPDGSVQQFEDGTHPDVIRSAWRPAPSPEAVAAPVAVPVAAPIAAPTSPEPAPWPTDPVGYAARGTTELLKGLVPGAASSVTSLVDTTGAIADFIRRRAGMEPGPLRGLARDWQQTAESWFPAHPEANLSRAVGEGIGQVGETVLEAWATGGGSLLPKAESLGARLLAGKQAAKAAGHYAAVRMAPAEFSDAYQRALDLGQDPDLAFAKSLGYATVAAMLEDRLGAGKLVRKLVSPELAGKVGSSTVGRFVRDALNNVASNALEEGSQRLAQDLIVGGKPTPGIGAEALVGGIVGGLVGAPGSVRTAVQRTSPEQRARVAELIAQETDPDKIEALKQYQGQLADIPDVKPKKLSFEQIAAKEFGPGVEFIPEAKPVPVYRGPALELASTAPFGEPVGDVQPVAGTYKQGAVTAVVDPEKVVVTGATPDTLPQVAGALVQQNLVKPVVEAGPLTEALKAEVTKVQAAPRYQVDAEVQRDKLRVYLPAIRSRAHLREILREEKAHTRIATPEGQAALAEFMRASPLSPTRYQKLVDDGYAARPGESDQEHKARLTDEFLAKLNRDPKWKQWSETAVAWVKKTFGMSLSPEQAGRLVLRSLRNVAPGGELSQPPTTRESTSREEAREAVKSTLLVQQATEQFPTAPRFQLGTETKFRGDHIELAASLAGRPQWEQQNEIRAAVMEAGVNLLPAKALSEDLYHRLNRAEPARIAAAARTLGVDTATPEGRQATAASVLMQHVHDARLGGRIGSWIPSVFKPDFGLMDSGSASSVARLASTLGLSLLGNRGARGLLAARQILQGIVEAAKQTEAMPSVFADPQQVAADLARHDIRTYQPWLDYLRGQAGELETHSYERQRLRSLTEALNGIADQGRARVVGNPETGLIDTPEGLAPVTLRPSSPNFPDEMEAVGRPLTEAELAHHAEYLAELAARRAVTLLDSIDRLSSTIAYLEANEARADLTEARAELGKLNEQLDRLGEPARVRAIEIRASDAALPHADAARRALADPALLDIAARIDPHVGRTLRQESELTPQEQSAMEVAAAVSANQAWVFRDRVQREAQAFRDNVYLPGMGRLRAKLLARLKTEGELTIAMHEVMAAAEGEAGQAGTLTGRAAAEALRDRDTAIMRFAEALARSAPDTEVGALRAALLSGGLVGVPLDLQGTVQAAAREAGISTDAVERILSLLRTSPEFGNAIVRLHDVASEKATRATISAIERIEGALRGQAQAEAKAEVGTPEDRVKGREEARQAREQVQAIATAHLRSLNSSARAVRRDVHDIQSQIAELEVQREHHDLLSDVADNAVTELPNIRRMVYEFQDGIKLDAFGDQSEVTIRPGQVYDAALIERIAEWVRKAHEQLDTVDPQTRRGLLVALGDENNPSLVGALVDLHATPETIAKTLAPSYPIDWLSRKGFFRTKEVLSRLVSGIWSSRILSTERNLVDIQRKVDLLQAREGAHRHKLMLQAFRSLELDPRTIGGQMKFRAVYNEFANELRQHESGVEAGQKVWSSGLEGKVLTAELITLLRNDRRVGRLGQGEAEKMPYGGVRENYPGRQVVRKSGETGDIGLARLVDGEMVQALAELYESAPKANGQVTDRSSIDVWWSSPAARDALRSHIRSASRTDMSTTRSAAMRTAEQQLAQAVSSGRVALASLRTIDDWADALRAYLPATVDPGTELRSELDQYGAIAVSRMPTPGGGPLQSTFAGRGEGDTTEFTSAAAQLAFPPSWYNYGAVDGLRSMLGRVADPAQVEYLAALKDAAADLNAGARRIETALQSDPGTKTQLLEDLAPTIRWHTTGLFSGQAVTDQRAEAAKTKMQVRASILLQEYDRTLRPTTDPIGRLNKWLSNIFPFLLLRLTAWASNVFGGPIALQPIYSRFWNTPLGTVGSLGTMALSAGSMVYNIGRDLGEYAGVVPHSVYQTFLDSEGVGSNFDRQASGEQEAFATGTLPRSRVQRGLDTVKGVADKASEYVGVRRGDRDLNLLMARNVGPAILRRIKTLAASPEVPLSPGVREWLSKFGQPEEVLSLVRDLNPARYYESKLGRRMVYALIEEANASTKVNRPNPNSLLTLMGWTTHMFQLLADQTRVTPSATRGEKARKVAINTVLGATAMSAAYYVQILGRRAMNEAVSNSAANLGVLLSGIPKDIEDPDLLEKLWNLLTELNGAIRSHVWGVGAVEDLAKAPIEALGRASVPAATLTPLHPDFWARDWQDVAGDLAMSAPKGIGLNSVQLPSLGIAEQVITAGVQAARGLKTIASAPSSAAQRAGGVEDLSTAGRNALNLLGLVGATVSELAFPGGNAGRASRSQIANAANQLGVKVEPGFQSGGWLNPTPVRKGLLAAGRELVDATTPEQVDAAQGKIDALTQFIAERAEKRALDHGEDAATAKQAGVDAVKRILPDLNPYRHAIGRPLTEKELADLRSKVGGNSEVSRDEQAAQAVTRAASRKYKFPVSRGMKRPIKRVRARVLTLR